VNSNRRARRVKVSADGTGLVSRAGTLLLRELTVDTGLAAGWTEALLDTYKAFPTRHLPGRVLADLAVAIADGDAGGPVLVGAFGLISPTAGLGALAAALLICAGLATPRNCASAPHPTAGGP
jgi:hypothetical protein